MSRDALFGLIILIALCIGPTMACIAAYRHSRRWDGVKRDRKNHWGGYKP